ncbi:hypothetical protein [Pedobacter sp. L105]|uniref:hypothetical protein n=1 Tax=Pedobacter sp. L105 TaxID=1641871 RepID=UPI00131DEFD2|nr:hypothetical protein [Pedobacter sp. L105]
MFLRIVCFLILYLSIGNIHAQEAALNTDIFLEKFAVYSKAHPDNLLFVHTDKTVYTNNETIWFSGYLIRTVAGNFSEHSVLSIALIKENEKKVFLLNQYLMQDGLCFGSLILPDSIPPGNYQLQATTNVLDKNGMPLTVFTQGLIIKSITEQAFSAELNSLETAVTNGMIRAKVTVNVKDPKEKVTVRYSVGNSASKSAILKANTFIMEIPSSQLDQASPVLLTSINYQKEIQYLSLNLPQVNTKKTDVRFFPEGGYLAEGLENTVGWETRDARHLPLSLSAVLYRDQLPVDTISTNSYGIGSFKIKPVFKSIYTVRVISREIKDTVFRLPAVLEDGLVLHVRNAAVKDSLSVEFSSKSVRNVQVLIHNYRQLFVHFQARVQASGKKITFVLSALPKGVAAITVLDSIGRPLAERLIYVHSDQRVTAVIKSDQPSYHKNEKVHLKFQFRDEQGHPVQGIVSVAVVQGNRLEISKQQNIENYVYLNHDLGVLPLDPLGKTANDKDYLENILLVKGWRRYTWPELIGVSPKDTLQKIIVSAMRGRVLFKSKPLKKPVTVSMFRDSSINIIDTQSDGTFLLTPEQVLTAEGRRVTFMVNKNDKYNYSIEYIDSASAGSQKAAEEIEWLPIGKAQYSQNSKDLVLPGYKNVISLKEVKIKARKADSEIYGLKKLGSNECGNYVCRYGFLNCPFHMGEVDNTQPVKGQRYKVYPISETLYTGCRVEEEPGSLLKIKGIYLSQEFYGAGEDPASFSAPQYFSTLLWKPGLIINEIGTGDLSFLTGSIAGQFKILVQGVSSKGMIYGTSSFVVN